jgi:hypothetical protein
MIHFEKDASPQFWLKLIDPNKLVYSIQTVKHQVIAIAHMAYVHYVLYKSKITKINRKKKLRKHSLQSTVVSVSSRYYHIASYQSPIKLVFVVSPLSTQH